MIPDTLEGWTLSVIEGLLRQGVFESDRFDFKEQLPYSKDDAAKLRLTKTCAAFANSGGGFLVFGVKDDKGLPAQQRIVGIEPGDDFPARFGNFPAAAEPSVEWTFRNPPLQLQDGRLVHIVQVRASPRKPHGVFDQERWWFCKRTSKGTEAMSFEEMRGLFVDASRRANEVNWLKAELERIRDLARTLNIESAEGRWSLEMLLSRFDAGPLNPLLLSLFDLLNSEPTLVSELHGLIDCCRKVDAALTHEAAFAVKPRDRSYSGSRLDPLDEVHERRMMIRIHGAASRALDALTRLRA